MKKRLSRRTRLAVVIGGLALFACIGYLSIGYYIYLQLATGSQGHGDNKNNTPISTENFLNSVKYRAQNLGRFIGTEAGEGFTSRQLLAIKELDSLIK